MQSGFTGGGSPDFYTTGRSMPNPLQPNTYRSQIPAGSFVDPTSQIARQIPTSLLGKRNLADLHHQHQNQALNNLLVRSVKPRTISSLPNFEFYSTMSLPSPDFHSQRLFGGGSGALLRQQQIVAHNGTNSAFPVRDLGVPGQNLVSAQESEKKIMDHRLQELEKQLFEDNDEDDGSDAASVITNANSAWCETIYNLISPGPRNPVSTSPTSSASSSSSSSSASSVASPVTDCWKQSVMEAASAISEGKLESIEEILSPVYKLSNSRGNSVQRLADYMVSALKSRANPTENSPPVAELYGAEHSGSTQLLYDVSPCFKLAFMAANLAILEAIGQEDRAKFHIVDFDIGQGGQYMNLLHVLSARQKGKLAVKLTTVAENGDDKNLKIVGESLSQLAERVGVSFKFNIVRQKLVDLTRESLGCEPDESLAVNFAFKLYRMPDESVSTENPRDELLRRVKGWAPAVVTLMEQEMNMNTAPFVTRVAESCAYYSSLFDSVESTVQREHPDRVKVEEGLGRRLANSLACEGRDRVERCELSGKWRARMGMAGFESKPLSQSIAESMKNRLSSGYRVNPGFTVKEEKGGICFGWMGRTLTVASAWR